LEAASVFEPSTMRQSISYCNVHDTESFTLWYCFSTRKIW